MQTPTVNEVYELVDRIAPFELCEPWDNAGILAGRRDAPVSGILVALDVNRAVIREAKSRGANLIISHHPILFHARKNLVEDDAEARILCELIRSGAALISAHTNFDVAPSGVNDSLSDALDLTGVIVLERGLRIGEYNGGASALLATASERLGGVLRVRGRTEKKKLRVCVCGGAGGELWRLASDAGADVYITGEAKHFDAMCAVEAGLMIVEAGHEETERVALSVLCAGLQNALNEVQYNIMVFLSANGAFTVIHGG